MQYVMKHTYYTYIHITMYMKLYVDPPCLYAPLICLLLALSSFLSAAIAIVSRTSEQIETRNYGLRFEPSMRV